ncbi:MAG: hypothetical protein OQL08_01455 [Gammaproteobacteria bacterium]|nr:hypothetical protein [Gammaproteobacteria bacterium]
MADLVQGNQYNKQKERILRPLPGLLPGYACTGNTQGARANATPHQGKAVCCLPGAKPGRWGFLVRTTRTGYTLNRSGALLENEPLKKEIPATPAPERAQTKIQRLQVKVTAIRKNPLLLHSQAAPLVADLLSVCMDLAERVERLEAGQ